MQGRLFENVVPLRVPICGQYAFLPDPSSGCRLCTHVCNDACNSVADFHSPFLPTTLPAPNSRGSRAKCLAPPHVFGRKPAFDTSTGQFIGFQWFDPASYGLEVPGTFGTCGVGTVRGPGLRTGDLSVQKEFPFSEFKRLEFRAEFFNVTNTPILNSPNIGLNFNLGLINSSQASATYSSR